VKGPRGRDLSFGKSLVSQFPVFVGLLCGALFDRESESYRTSCICTIVAQQVLISTRTGAPLLIIEPFVRARHIRRTKTLPKSRLSQW